MDNPNKNKLLLSSTNLSPLLKLLIKKNVCLIMLREEKIKSNNNTLSRISIILFFMQ